MDWFQDEDLWVGFADVMFPEHRAEEGEKLVATSPLLKVSSGMKVLDLACGPAVHVVPLARAGADVTGVDLSPAMLARARAACERADVSARLVEANMLDFVEPDTYDLVINMYTSFGYFTEPGDNLRVLRNIRESLAPGGAAVIDLLGKEVLAGWVGRPQAVDVASGGTVYMRDTILDDWTRLRTDWTFVRDGEVRETSIHAQLYSAAELRALFTEAGFTDVACYGGFDASPYDNHATRLIVRGIRGD